MTQKQKTAAIIGIACLVVAFAFIYRQFAMRSGSWDGDTMSPSAPAMMPPSAPKKSDDALMQQQKAVVPTTPDNAADKISDSLSADDSALDKEASAEADAAAESVSTIDDVTNAYDTTQK